jgi:hypothetical protein
MLMRLRVEREASGQRPNSHFDGRSHVLCRRIGVDQACVAQAARAANSVTSDHQDPIDVSM